MANKIIVPTGYMGSGSSAVTNLISEIDGYDINNGTFEYVFTHCPDGLFDLEDKLLHGNNALRSDEAIHRFLDCMQRLDKPGYWFSGYTRKVTPQFYPLCRQLIDDLHPVNMDDVYWYWQEDIDTFPLRMLWHLRGWATRLTGRHFPKDKPLKPLDYDDLHMAYPTADEFYTAARTFLSRFYAALDYDKHHLVLDQFLLPHNLFRIGNYFDDSLRVFAVDRDPRDQFILNKYIWLRDHVAVPLPTDAAEFCRLYAAMRRSEKPCDDPRVLRVHFEDLIYRYDETTARILAHLGVDPARHAAKKGTIFKPEISINNTQLFRRTDRYAEEIRIIEAGLPEYLYDFPPLPAGDEFKPDQLF